ncbi:MAG TPA: hypothetical protein PL183_13500, partial [Aquamicrobium sp.]|nr:hypothetical protein [Aquamicrobium sp.]
EVLAAAGLADRSYVEARWIVSLADHAALDGPDRDAAAGALAMFNRDARPGNAYRSIEALLARVYGPADRRKGISAAAIEARRM